MELKVRHNSEHLYFYDYEGDSKRTYISEKVQDGEDLNAGEFGFVSLDQKTFKMTEDVYMPVTWLKEIADFIEKMQ